MQPTQIEAELMELVAARADLQDLQIERKALKAELQTERTERAKDAAALREVYERTNETVRIQHAEALRAALEQTAGVALLYTALLSFISLHYLTACLVVLSRCTIALCCLTALSRCAVSLYCITAEAVAACADAHEGADVASDAAAQAGTRRLVERRNNAQLLNQAKIESDQTLLAVITKAADDAEQVAALHAAEFGAAQDRLCVLEQQLQHQVEVNSELKQRLSDTQQRLSDTHELLSTTQEKFDTVSRKYERCWLSSVQLALANTCAGQKELIAHWKHMVAEDRMGKAKREIRGREQKAEREVREVELRCMSLESDKEQLTAQLNGLNEMVLAFCFHSSDCLSSEMNSAMKRVQQVQVCSLHRIERTCHSVRSPLSYHLWPHFFCPC